MAVPALDAIAESGHQLVGVVTRPDAPSGRGRKLVASPVAQRAEELGVPVLKPAHPKDPEFQAELKALEPDCCPVVAYGALLPQSALDIPEHGWVNLHFSILPAWRGAAPVQHALWAGDEVTRATTFRIVRELDAGPTFGVVTETVRPTDTAGDLLGRLAESGAGLLVATLDGIEDGSLEAQEQPADGVSFAPKILVEDAEVDWTEPAVAVDRRVRACTPDRGRGRRTPASGSRSARSPWPTTASTSSRACSRSPRTPCTSAPRPPRAARRGQGVRQEADAGRGLGARGARRLGRDVRWLTPARRAGTAAAARARAAVVGPRGARAVAEAARRPGVPGPRATSTRPARSRSRC